MFLPFYLILLTFNIAATLACAVYCFKIAKFKITPTFTWMSFFTAFCLRFFTQIQYIVFVGSGTASEAGMCAFLLIIQSIESSIVAAFLIGISRTYYIIKRSPLSG